MKELFEIAQYLEKHPHLPFALATVLAVTGSSYRRPGARMLIDARDRVLGSISGGCLEKDVISRAHAVLLSNQPELVSYDTTDQDDWSFGSSLGCQGNIQILIEPLPASGPRPLVEAIAQLNRLGSPIPWITQTRHRLAPKSTTQQPLAVPVEITHPSADLFTPLLDLARAKRRPMFESTAPDLLVLAAWLTPKAPLVILGAGLDAQPLVRLAAEIGFHILVIDRRPTYADAAAFPLAQAVLCYRPHELPRQLQPLNAESAVVVMNHHYETDRDWLGQLATQKLAYLGVLGPRKRTTKMIDELRSAGKWPKDDSAVTIHGPAGLDIGSETPEQIALAILAEIVAVRSGRDAAPLKDRSSPIHGA